MNSCRMAFTVSYRPVSFLHFSLFLWVETDIYTVTRHTTWQNDGVDAHLVHWSPKTRCYDVLRERKHVTCQHVIFLYLTTGGKGVPQYVAHTVAWCQRVEGMMMINRANAFTWWIYLEWSVHSCVGSFTYACISMRDGHGAGQAALTDNKTWAVLCTSLWGDCNDKCRLDLQRW